jgi:hypothetical protein
MTVFNEGQNSMTTAACPSPPSVPDHQNLRLTLLTEICNALRVRSEAEHLYTAAAVGGFGAVAWGVAALRPERYLSRPSYKQPGVVAGIGILVVAALIVLKIYREHTVYADTKREQARMAGQLASLPGAARIIPQYMLEEKAGWGFILSIFVVAATAIVTAVFCLEAT